MNSGCLKVWHLVHNAMLVFIWLDFLNYYYYFLFNKQPTNTTYTACTRTQIPMQNHMYHHSFVYVSQGRMECVIGKNDFCLQSMSKIVNGMFVKSVDNSALYSQVIAPFRVVCVRALICAHAKVKKYLLVWLLLYSVEPRWIPVLMQSSSISYMPCKPFWQAVLKI